MTTTTTAPVPETATETATQTAAAPVTTAPQRSRAAGVLAQAGIDPKTGRRAAVALLRRSAGYLMSRADAVALVDAVADEQAAAARMRQWAPHAMPLDDVLAILLRHYTSATDPEVRDRLDPHDWSDLDEREAEAYDRIRRAYAPLDRALDELRADLDRIVDVDRVMALATSEPVRIDQDTRVLDPSTVRPLPVVPTRIDLPTELLVDRTGGVVVS